MTRYVSLPLTAGELEVLDRLGETLGVSRAGVLQQLVRRRAARAGLDVTHLFTAPAPRPKRGPITDAEYQRIAADTRGTLAERATRHGVAISTVFKIHNGFARRRA